MESDPAGVPPHQQYGFARDYYELLEIPRTADKEAIKKAYRKQALRNHPDKVGSDPEKVAKFQAISRANEVLSDDKKRSIYDKYGEQGVIMMDRIPFIDPEILLALNRTILIATLFVIALLLFPIFISLRADGKVSWSWPVSIILSIAMAPNEGDADEDDEDAHTNSTAAEETNLTPEERQKKKKRSNVTEKIGACVYLVVVLSFIVLLSLRLHGLFESWWVVFVPWYLLEGVHFLMSAKSVLGRISKGLVVEVQPVGRPEGEEQEAVEMFTREFTGMEVFGLVSEELVGWGLRIAQGVLVPLKLMNPDAFSWAITFTPAFLIGGVHFLSIILSCVHSRTDKSVPPEVNSDRRSRQTARFILLAIASILMYTMIGLLIRRLNHMDTLDPSSAVILIPAFIVLSLVLMVVGCCLPCMLCLTRMGLQAELRNAKDEGTWMRSVVPSDRRIEA
ncbi:hypothetical protein BC829DRAFT_406232 [Chytridium lagenaria]|nr:hypothetical protein BC829DRAFT_406232 [Chytridium lagenaria]